MLLDLKLVSIDLGLLQAIRRVSSVPVLMLTARDKVADRIHRLQSGADDYLAMPFSVLTLFVRLQALSESGRATTYAAEVGRPRGRSREPYMRAQSNDAESFRLKSFHC